MARYKIGDMVYIGKSSEPNEIVFVSTCISPEGEEGTAYLLRNKSRFFGEEEIHMFDDE